MRAAWLFLALCCGACGPAERPLTVFAAASLVDVLDELARTPGVPPFECHVAGSEVLLRQVQAGAPADLLVLARALRAEELPGLTRPVTLATTRLVVAARSGAPRRPATPAELPGLRLALADPLLAPAGAYAQAALRAAGLEQACEPGLRRAAHVRDACRWALLGEVDAVLCYRVDSVALDGLVECFELGQETIPYQALVVAPPGRAAAARAWLAALRSEPATAVLRRHGFELPAP